MATKKTAEVKTTASKSTKSTEPEKDWFATGAEGMQRKQQQDAIGAAKKERGVGRFFMKEKEEALVTFIGTDAGFYIHEHNLKLNGRWGNFVTCTKDWKPCPVCEAGHKPTYTAYYTVIDHREFELKNGPKAGTKVKNRKLLYPAKGSTMTILADLKKEHKTLVGRTFLIKRLSSEDPNCGRDFSSKGALNAAQWKALAAAAKVTETELKSDIEYRKVLKPMDDVELAGLGFGTSTLGGDEEVRGAAGGSSLSDIVDI